MCDFSTGQPRQINAKHCNDWSEFRNRAYALQFDYRRRARFEGAVSFRIEGIHAQSWERRGRGVFSRGSEAEPQVCPDQVSSGPEIAVHSATRQRIRPTAAKAAGCHRLSLHSHETCMVINSVNRTGQGSRDNTTSSARKLQCFLCTAEGFSHILVNLFNFTHVFVQELECLCMQGRSPAIRSSGSG
jgi:hypothetical protein